MDLMNLTNTRKVHFIGIGGAGMSGLADILIEMGIEVSGSDRESSAATDYLKGRGATFFLGHAFDNVGDANLLVYSSAVAADNPEIMEAKKRRIPSIKRAELLGILMKEKEGIAIAGTHGKTTTTSIVGHMLVENKLDPTIVVGGKMQNSQTNAKLGKGKYFVTEADEYDRSFLTLFPKISVVTSLEEDHLDIYKDLADLKNTFAKFTNQTAFDGLVLLNKDDENVMELEEHTTRKTQTFGLSKESDVIAKNITFKNGRTSFDVEVNGQIKGNIELNMPGTHNIKNALAAVSVGLKLGISFVGIKKSLSSFTGVQRRFEFKAEIDGIHFYDDYAHHPSEVRAAISAAKSGWNKRVVIVFQPHLFSRTLDFSKDFAFALDMADKVILAPIYPARENPIPGVTSSLISEQMEKECILLDEKELIEAAILKEAKSGDLVITMGAGDIWLFGEMAINQLQERGRSAQ